MNLNAGRNSRRQMLSQLALCLGTLCLVVAIPAHAADNPKIVMDVAKKGTLVIELYPDAAPKTVAHILSLVKQKFYDGVKIHRVEPNFVVQWGDPNSKKITPAEFDANHIGTGGSGTNVPLEVKLAHEQYTLGLARAQAPNTGDSQMFINLKANHFLDSGYCVFGKVIKGQELSDKLAVGDVITSIHLEGKSEGKSESKSDSKSGGKDKAKGK